MPGDLQWSALSAGLHLSGSNGSTSFPDVKGHSFYRTGAVAISTAQSRFAGEGSAYFPGGINDLLKCNAHADFGSAGTSLSISWSMYPTALPPAGTACRMIMIGTNDSTAHFAIAFDQWGNLGGYIPKTGYNSLFSNGSVTLNAWSDYDFSVFNRFAVLSKNGAVIASMTGLDSPVGAFPKRIQIGGDDSGFSSVDARFNGYISEVRIMVSAGRIPLADALTGPFPEGLSVPVITPAPPSIALIRQSPPAWKALCRPHSGLVVDAEHGGHGRIVGTVKNTGSPDYPVIRKVRLLRKRDGVLARETWSDAVGNYVFDHIRHDVDYVVLAHDHTGLYNAVIADSLTPDLIT